MSKPVIHASTVVSQSQDLVSTNVSDQVALMSIANGAYYGMDKIGSRIWELIVEPRPVSGVVDQLLGEFEVERPTCEQQVLAFLQQLSDADLLVLA